jgi:hypothetical protein
MVQKKSISDWLNSISNVLVIGIGGGGDAISAYPTINYLKNANKNIYFANIHVSSDPENFKLFSKLSYGNAAFILNEQPLNEKRARCIELILESQLKVPCYSCLSNYGVSDLSNSLKLIIEENNIDGIIAIDGGTDSLASIDTNITSIINDAISLAALSILNFSIIPIGIIGCCADLEMDLDKFMLTFSSALKNGSYLGVIDFPINHDIVYESLII